MFHLTLDDLEKIYEVYNTELTKINNVCSATKKGSLYLKKDRDFMLLKYLFLIPFICLTVSPR